MRGLKRQQAAASTDFVGRFLLALSYFSLLLSVLNDLTGPSAGPLARTTYSIFHSILLPVLRRGSGLTLQLHLPHLSRSRVFGDRGHVPCPA